MSEPSLAPSPVARTLNASVINEFRAQSPQMRDVRRKDLAKGMMRKQARDLNTQNLSSTKNYYFQHATLGPLLNQVSSKSVDLKRGLDLNSVIHLAAAIEAETQANPGTFGAFINILRHLLLIPNDNTLATRIWNLIEMFVHRVVISKADDGRKDVAKLSVAEFEQSFGVKNNIKAIERHLALDAVTESISILFPKLVSGDKDADPHFRPPMMPKMSTRNMLKDAGGLAPGPPGVPVPPGSGPPPPPPPPGLKGPPPPPGKMAVVKPTMKRFNWLKLLPPQIPPSVFHVIANSGETPLPVDPAVLLSKFMLKAANATLAATSTPKTMNLIDGRKAQNLGILLTSIKHSFDKIREAIITVDPSVLTVSNAISLIKLLPTDDEKSLLANYKTDTTIGKPEKFLIEIMDVPYLRERLEGFVFQREFEFRVEDAQNVMQSMTTALEEVKEDENLQRIFKLVLDIGNTMNTGYTDRNGGNALGFKSSSLLRLQDTKSADNKSNLLQYVVEYLEEHDQSLLETDEGLQSLKHASKEQLQLVQQEVKEMSDKLNSLEFSLQKFTPMSDEDVFKDKMVEFMAPAKAKLQELAKQFATTKQMFNTVSAYFGEDGDQEDFVKILLEFFKMLEKAWIDVVVAREQAEKKAKKDALAAKRKAALEAANEVVETDTSKEDLDTSMDETELNKESSSSPVGSDEEGDVDDRSSIASSDSFQASVRHITDSPLPVPRSNSDPPLVLRPVLDPLPDSPPQESEDRGTSQETSRRDSMRDRYESSQSREQRLSRRDSTRPSSIDRHESIRRKSSSHSMSPAPNRSSTSTLNRSSRRLSLSFDPGQITRALDRSTGSPSSTELRERSSTSHDVRHSGTLEKERSSRRESSRDVRLDRAHEVRSSGSHERERRGDQEPRDKDRDRDKDNRPRK